jgi:hypothetical protein
MVLSKSTVEQLKPKQKNQLKLRNNQKKTGNVLIIGSSITKDINTKTLKENVTVNTNRNGFISEFLVLYSDSFC